jgi:primosomal replication protein N''
MLESDELTAKVTALARADNEMRQLNRTLLVQDIDVWHLGNSMAWEEIFRLRGPRALRLREFFERGKSIGLMLVRPIWLMNPDVASRLLPLQGALFDTVIYDEASQIPVEFALPSLYRARSFVVSGDERQMPPTTFFSSRIENDEAEILDPDEVDEVAGEEQRAEQTEKWDRREIKDCPDLLQLAKATVPSVTLEVHYRSSYRELIAFSNAAFYADRLHVPCRHPEAEVRRVMPLEVVRVDGVYSDQTNPREAKEVVERIARLWAARPEERNTVGVVTFNRKQADLIEELLEERAENDPVFAAALAHERERIENGEDMGFFVKNVENVQGDERDVIIFSSTFGRNSQGSFRRTFGVLGQTGGERRLNVAVSRAREKVVLVTSMPINEVSDLLATRRTAASPRDFLQAYLEYARALTNGELDNAQSLLKRLSAAHSGPDRPRRLQSDGIRTAVATFIRRDLGQEVSELNDDGAFGLDFGIVDPRTGLYGIGIECDAPLHPLLQRARAREMWRPSVLRRAFPVLHRVSSHGWYHDREREQQRLRGAVNQALTQEKV